MGTMIPGELSECEEALMYSMYAERATATNACLTIQQNHKQSCSTGHMCCGCGGGDGRVEVRVWCPQPPLLMHCSATAPPAYLKASCSVGRFGAWECQLDTSSLVAMQHDMEHLRRQKHELVVQQQRSMLRPNGVQQGCMGRSRWGVLLQSTRAQSASSLVGCAWLFLAVIGVESNMAMQAWGDGACCRRIQLLHWCSY